MKMFINLDSEDDTEFENKIKTIQERLKELDGEQYENL